MRLRLTIVTFLLCAAVFAADYTGPRPPKTDLLYLVHADNLIPTEAIDAQQETKKNDVIYTVQGSESPSKTPLAEPIFIIQADKIQPSSLELYKMEVKGGHREAVTSLRHTRGSKPLRLSVTRLDRGLFKVEVDQELENGEYGISPNGSNTVFCFGVY